MEFHDPFNNPELAHPRARELMTEAFFWDCTLEEAPFGSDEGSDAYSDFREWRQGNPDADLVECISWILEGRLDDYDPGLCLDERVEQDLADPDNRAFPNYYTMFVLDATVIASAFGQLVDEGRIDAAAKPYVEVAILRQLHPKLVMSDIHRDVLHAEHRVLALA